VAWHFYDEGRKLQLRIAAISGRLEEDMAETLRGPIFEEKVVDFILELAKVTNQDVPAEELMREPEAAMIRVRPQHRPTAGSSPRRHAQCTGANPPLVAAFRPQSSRQGMILGHLHAFADQVLRDKVLANIATNSPTAPLQFQSILICQRVGPGPFITRLGRYMTDGQKGLPSRPNA
jgi:hypothetical protein